MFVFISFSSFRRSAFQEFPDLLSYGRNYLDLNGPSKTLSESFRRSFGVSRAYLVLFGLAIFLLGLAIIVLIPRAETPWIVAMAPLSRSRNRHTRRFGRRGLVAGER